MFRSHHSSPPLRGSVIVSAINQPPRAALPLPGPRLQETGCPRHNVPVHATVNQRANQFYTTEQSHFSPTAAAAAVETNKHKH